MIPLQNAGSLGTPKLLSRQDLVSVILKLKHEGWVLALQEDPGLTNCVSEPYMNGRLYQGMVKVRDARGLTNLYIVETPAVRPSPQSALAQREPDVILLFAEFGANEPHAIIECKRIDPHESPKQLRGEYVRSGMDRFIDGAYGSGHDLDFMVGYLLSGDGDAAVADINDHLQNVGRPACSLQKATTGSVGYVAESNHTRPSNGSSLRLMHSFLPF